ncbi:hypothetical protein BRC68_17140 [Halobacteriales archaeon QH_6_64_20]|nr:MAG: hypothetical protein BRC68_17140 [Halobacteriales archaeon QH_6_64_20]
MGSATPRSSHGDEREATNSGDDRTVSYQRASGEPTRTTERRDGAVNLEPAGCWRIWEGFGTTVLLTHYPYPPAWIDRIGSRSRTGRVA